MKAFYWSFSAIRGFLTLIVAIAVVALPNAAADFLSIPVVVALAVACYASYTIFDGAAMVLLANLLPAWVVARRALYLQAGGAAIMATLLFLVGYRVLPLTALFWVAAAQAAIAAMAELRVARGTHRQYGCASCYSTAMVLAFAGVTLPFAGLLSPSGMILALGTYLALYGASEFTLGTRMLFVEYRAAHPVPAVITANWLAEMAPAPQVRSAPPPPSFDCVTSLTCDVCPAEVICSDNSIPGKMANILASRQPAIINSVRASAVLQQH